MAAAPPETAGRSRTPIRPSRAGRRRALVLLGVHLLFAAHIGHWLATGRTLTPLEPSEAMEFSKHSIVNAGLVFFVLTLLSTAVLGRWFCGWACHLVALQDGCRWLLLRAGLRPRPLRSRWLLWVPLLAFAYMFLWPLAWRLGQGESLAVRGFDFVRSGFWDTMPGLAVGLLTLFVCGFVAIWFLGAKGYCTYACPYGAAYAFLDRFAPGRIRVNEACEGCGHCTAVCSSNVAVHREVRDFGMVVDPGCMKCLDCVSVCPKDALSFGFGRPALGARARVPAPERPTPAWSRAEEALLLLLFAAAFLSFRGLYGRVPFLLALGLGGIFAVLQFHLLRALRAPDLRLQNLRLKAGGRWTGAGLAAAAAGIVLLVLQGHSAWIRWHAFQADTAFARLQEARSRLAHEGFRPVPLDQAEEAAVARVLEHAGLVRRRGLLRDPAPSLQLAWATGLRGDLGDMETWLRDALEAAPDEPLIREMLADYLAETGRVEEAAGLYEGLTREGRARASLWTRYALALQILGRGEEAREALRRALETDPDFAPARALLEEAREGGS